MAGFSKYPNQIDDSSTLPIATDNVTPVKAEVVNRLRDAVLALESELGIDPSREFGTVRARLDAMQSGTGGGGAIEILQNGVEVLPSAVSLDFVGNVNITIPQPLRAKIEIIGGQATQIQETIAVNFNGQTIFTLSNDPIEDIGVMMFVNGIKQQMGVDYTSTDTTVTYTGSISLITSDEVEFWYLVDLGSIGGSGGAVTVQYNGLDIDTATTLFNFTGGATVTSIAAGQVEVHMGSNTKIRTFRSTSNLSGSAVSINKTVIWNGSSTLVTAINASLAAGNTQITTTTTGHFLVEGQLTISPTIDAVSGIIIEVLLNGSTVVHTVSDYGSVWGVGIDRSFAFCFPIDLTSGNTLEVRWRHSGSALSTQDLVFGDDLSWFAISEQ